MISAAIHSGQPLTLVDFRAEQTKTNAKLEQIAAILADMKSIYTVKQGTT